MILLRTAAIAALLGALACGGSASGPTPAPPVIVFGRLFEGQRDIYRVALDGENLVRLTSDLGDDREPTVAGETVVFTSYRAGNAELYSIPLAGGAERRLTNTSVNEIFPALSVYPEWRGRLVRSSGRYASRSVLRRRAAAMPSDGRMAGE